MTQQPSACERGAWRLCRGSGTARLSFDPVGTWWSCFWWRTAAANPLLCGGWTRSKTCISRTNPQPWRHYHDGAKRYAGAGCAGSGTAWAKSFSPSISRCSTLTSPNCASGGGWGAARWPSVLLRAKRTARRSASGAMDCLDRSAWPTAPSTSRAALVADSPQRSPSRDADASPQGDNRTDETGREPHTRRPSARCSTFCGASCGEEGLSMLCTLHQLDSRGDSCRPKEATRIMKSGGRMCDDRPPPVAGRRAATGALRGAILVWAAVVERYDQVCGRVAELN